MGFMDCLDERLANDDLSPMMKERAEEMFNNLKSKATNKTDEMELAEQAIDKLEGRLNLEKMNELRQLEARAQLKDELRNSYGDQDFVRLHKGGTMEVLSSGETLMGTLSPNIGEPTGISNVEILQSNLKNDYLSTATQGLRQMSKQDTIKGRIKSTVTENKIDFKNVMRELNGEKVKLTPEEEEFAKGLREGLNKALLDYKMAGGKIHFKEDYIPNPIHDAEEIRNVGKREWVEQTKSLLDRQAMKKFDTDTPMTGQELDDLLADIHDNIVNERSGDVDLNEIRKQKFSERQSDQRILHFENTDAWLEYNKKFGKSVSPLDAVTSKINRFAKETAFMKRFGPNPDRGARVAKNIVAEHADEVGTNQAQKSFQKMTDEFQSVYNIMRGEHRTHEQGLVANGIDNLNAVAQAGTIGSAGPTVVAGDLSTQYATALADGLPQGKLIANQVKNIINWSRGSNIQQIAAEAGFGADVYIQESLAQARFFGELKTGGLLGPATRFMSDKVTKYSGVSPWTSSSRATWNVEFMKHLARTSKLDWDQLNASASSIEKAIPMYQGADEAMSKFRNTLERYNFTRDDWRVLQKTENYKSTQFKKNFSWMDSDFEMLRPGDIATDEMAEKTGRTLPELRTIEQKVRRMIKSEEKFATPTATTRARETLKLNVENMWGRKVLDLTSMYKTFPMMIFQMHLPRMIKQGGTAESIGLGSTFLLTTTLAGMFSLQMSELSKGRNPRSFNDTQTWMDAMARGGGLSFAGDLALGDPTRFGSSPVDNIIGPGIGLAGDIVGTAKRTGMAAAGADDANAGRAASDLIRRWAPGGNMFYARLAFERGVADNLQRFLDDDAQESFNRELQFIEREFDQTAYSDPGSGLGEIETPDLGELFE